MKLTIETKDIMQAKRMLKADDMAYFIFWIKNNAWRKFEDSEVDYRPVFDEINEMINAYGINIDELVG